LPPAGRRLSAIGDRDDKGTADLLHAAILAGADLIGGIDPCGLDRDPVEHLDIVFGLAERHHVGIDIHLHESGDLGAFTFELIGERTEALGMQGMVTISHGFGLSSVGPARQAALIDMLARNDIALTTVAPGTTEPLPIAALAPPASASVSARTGSVTSGRHTATATCWSGRGSWPSSTVSGSALIEACVDVASRGGRSVVHGGPWPTETVLDDTRFGLAIGAPADLVVVAPTASPPP
jgi:hypothetical protein